MIKIKFIKEINDMFHHYFINHHGIVINIFHRVKYSTNKTSHK